LQKLTFKQWAATSFGFYGAGRTSAEQKQFL
jgi:hypothetical protein